MKRTQPGIKQAFSICEGCDYFQRRGDLCRHGGWDRPDIAHPDNLLSAEASCPAGKWGPEVIDAPAPKLEPDAEPQRWAVGVTTAPRLQPTLADTLASLEAAGWDRPMVFADGDAAVPPGYPVTRRQPIAGAFCNWWLSFQELFCRQPGADFYLLVQDDVAFARDVREYVESQDWRGVLSLYQSGHYTHDGVRQFRGGSKFVGALALAFDRDAATRILSSDLAIWHRQRRDRANDYIDGAVGDWCLRQDVPLWIHGPSLCQHTGTTSTLGHQEQPSSTFVGESVSVAVHRQRGDRIGVVGFNTAQGLGYVNRAMAKWLDVDRWLVTTHSRFPELDPVQGVTHVTLPHDASDEQTRELIRELDTVVFVEVCPDNLPRIAKEQGVRTVCVPMVEWLPVRHDWMQHVDTWLAATAHSYFQLLARQVAGEVKFCPWPIDCSEFPYRRRCVADRFVFAHGNGGPRDRKGGKLMAEAARMAPDLPLIVYSQVQDGMTSSLTEEVAWPSSVDFRGSVENPADLYADGDVFVLPARWEGLGLQLYESQACGMPLITTDAPPMNEANPWRRLPFDLGQIKLSHPYPTCRVRPATIVRFLEDALRSPIAGESRRAAEWVRENRDWSKRAADIRQMIV